MALSFSDNIGYSGSRNNFERDYYATIADMVAVKKTRMPTMFIAMCGETGKAYLYNKSNEVDTDPCDALAILPCCPAGLSINMDKWQVARYSRRLRVKILGGL